MIQNATNVVCARRTTAIFVHHSFDVGRDMLIIIAAVAQSHYFVAFCNGFMLQ
jgi:hypothetical protein